MQNGVDKEELAQFALSMGLLSLDAHAENSACTTDKVVIGIMIGKLCVEEDEEKMEIMEHYIIDLEEPRAYLTE